ncbi:MAG: hypothetical protein AAF542_24665 [Pseudomonadota bacterium]
MNNENVLSLLSDVNGTWLIDAYSGTNPSLAVGNSFRFNVENTSDGARLATISILDDQAVLTAISVSGSIAVDSSIAHGNAICTIRCRMVPATNNEDLVILLSNDLDANGVAYIGFQHWTVGTFDPIQIDTKPGHGSGKRP